MGRSVVTIGAVHAAFISGGNLFGAQRSSAIDIFSYIAISILHANPGNNLSLLIGRDETDFIRKIHVPMNSRHRAIGWVTPANINQHSRLSEGILLIVCVMIKRLELSAIKLRTPMTLLASFIGRSHVMNGSFNRF